MHDLAVRLPCQAVCHSMDLLLTVAPRAMLASVRSESSAKIELKTTGTKYMSL